jgi:rhodanese-related sulfurtransferase
MKKLLFYILILFSASVYSQKTLDKLLKKHNTKAIPYISVEAFANQKDESIILDTRENKEYNVSHLKDAIYVGYDFFQIDSVLNNIKNKDEKIVVYCSLGIRSETIGIKLKKAGYTNIHNLYGGIFEWKNNEFPVYNSAEKETDSIHTYSKAWSKWLKKGIKILD